MVTKLKAIASPFKFDTTGYPAPAFEDNVLADSLRTILLTTPGERVMRPTFGCWVKMILFENISGATARRATFEVKRAIRDWEPRVDVLDVDIILDSKKRQILLHITWRASDRVRRTTVTLENLPNVN